MVRKVKKLLSFAIAPLKFYLNVARFFQFVLLNSFSLIRKTKEFSVLSFPDYSQCGKMLKIDLKAIDFVQAMNNYVAFHRG